MKYLKLLSFLSISIFAVSSTAHAEAVTYRGAINGVPVTLTLEMKLPVSFKVVNTPVYHDPEMSNMPGQTYVQTDFNGSITETYGSAVKSSSLDLEGSVKGDSVHFIAQPIRTYFKELGGLLLEGNVIDSDSMPFSLSHGDGQIDAIHFPPALDLRWTLNGDYYPADQRDPNQGMVHLIQQ